MHLRSLILVIGLLYVYCTALPFRGECVYMHVCSRGRAAACVLFKAFHFRLGARVPICMHVRVAGLLYACCLRRGASVQGCVCMYVRVAGLLRAYCLRRGASV